MKNIHVLSTTQDSWLCLKDGELVNANDGGCMLGYDPPRWLTQHIYITSDEEIKEGDWYLDTVANVLFKNDKIFLNGLGYKKIILTTDQDLIKDGVQAIDDEFLEWFVKNPSCEEVDVKKESHIKIEEVSYKGDFQNVEYINYKIIIPKEEPKQETLEEVAERIYLSYKNNDLLYGHSEELQLAYKAGIVDGAKWQQERSYSEEEVILLLQKALTHKDDGEIGSLVTAQGQIRTANFFSWFEQVKKK